MIGIGNARRKRCALRPASDAWSREVRASSPAPRRRTRVERPKIVRKLNVGRRRSTVIDLGDRPSGICRVSPRWMTRLSSLPMSIGRAGTIAEVVRRRRGLMVTMIPVPPLWPWPDVPPATMQLATARFNMLRPVRFPRVWRSASAYRCSGWQSGLSGPGPQRLQPISLTSCSVPPGTMPVDG